MSSSCNPETANGLQLWQQFIDVSVEHCQELYEKLHITLSKSDITPESYYNDKLASVISELEEKHLLEESDGCKMCLS